ncbi:MAG: sulfite exporter TauE/SafE family protein [Desulfovibrionaceae bacterium]|nr:sulfite exporter TauE/SafE family protein [Desulfovibrionaceae bacterium]
MEQSVLFYLVLAFSALMAGISKTGIPGVAIAGSVLVPLVMPAKLSTGYVLPFLLFADIIAVIYWRRAAVMRYIIALLPAMFAGIILGFFLMDCIPDAVYGKVLGSIVILLIIMDAACRHRNIRIPENSRLFAWSMGLLAGVMTMLANAASPAMMLYLLAMNISKEQFVGTGAWIYFAINAFKVPFSIALGLMTLESLRVNLILLPCIVLGSILGVCLIRRISGPLFEKVMRGMILVGGIKLFF